MIIIDVLIIVVVSILLIVNVGRFHLKGLPIDPAARHDTDENEPRHRQQKKSNSKVLTRLPLPLLQVNPGALIFAGMILHVYLLR